MNGIDSIDVVIKEKPIEVSWDEIRRVIYMAHTDSSKQGDIQISANLSSEEIKEKVGNGVCYVAIYNGQVVGTCSVVLRMKRTWFYKGIAAYYLLDAVLPEFQGLGIYSRLDEKRNYFARCNGVNMVYMYTSESNYKVQHIREKQGFRLMSFYVSPKTDYYSVLMAKWLSDCPFPKWYCRLRYILSKMYVKIRFRRGMVRRFI